MDKSEIRETLWHRLAESGEARFPFPVAGRIPNFAGARAAADRVSTLPEWKQADTVKANPDYAQYHVRINALEAGKDVFVAVPRLSTEACFFHLDPTTIDDPADAATINGASEWGTPRHPADLPSIEFVIVGSVGVCRDGGRVGKGEGYSDLEFAILQEFNRVSASTPVVTTVHNLQVFEGSIPLSPHDVPLTWICTPTRAVETTNNAKSPDGIDWSLVTEDDIEEKPVLNHIRERED